ncbi:NAD(P)/FAD-dependent oxidoreductase [Herbiconiux flava]|uniref:Glycine/D-amino acid oxidase-like deaminating enzyme n=1 Tax=Herbiconiux flava TaxID=881268 RepID=A0A852SHP8_9MICO|nr:FAD-dependent oxidoreductase [Herbiconiux flava]NYD69184.1 glycine/D-amino acid oxidase-like deaminating enzyme [Herbiconiux flava]GLK15932.1 oxidoreductase [Herbiconiux flava]
MTRPLPAYSHVRRTDPAMLRESLRDASTTPFWLDSPGAPDPEPPLEGATTAQLGVVGGGYCGLWTALRAKERDPAADVVLLEGRRIGWAASGRNGGFCESSLTHGSENGERHFARELDVLDRLAAENFAELAATLERHGIDAEYEETGVLVAATEPHQVEGLRASVAGDDVYLDRAELDARSLPAVYRAAVQKHAGYAYVNPAKLAWGLKAACLALGVRVFEGTPALGLHDLDDRVRVSTPAGAVTADRVALATNGFPSLLKRTRLYTVPIYDYVLMTEPLSPAQLAGIGWEGRHGVTDSSRQFHYSRKSADDRILFGGFDAIYHPGRRIRPAQDQREETFEALADHFFTTYPSLAGIRFTHKWGGMIDMSTKLVAFHGRALGGKAAYSAGYTGLGVAATRFGADTMLDLLSGEDSERTRLSMARRKPVPVPPEPFATPLIELMRRAVVRSDERGGKDGPLLKLADAFGVGFDS